MRIDTPVDMIKRLARNIIASVNDYQAAEKADAESRSTAASNMAQTAKGVAACDMMVTIQQMLSELGCVMTTEGIIGKNEYYVIEKKNF